MSDCRSNRRTPTALGLGLAAILTLAAAGGSPGHAQTSDWTLEAALQAGEPTYNRPYLYGGTCYLSSIGTAVIFDIHEFRLDDAVAPADLAVSLCEGADFDSVLYLYQRADGAAGAFNSADPCARLVGYSDDYCGSASLIWTTSLVLGHVTAVVTSYMNGETGAYTLTADSAGSYLQNYIFYSGFETANVRTWSEAVLN